MLKDSLLLWQLLVVLPPVGVMERPAWWDLPYAGEQTATSSTQFVRIHSAPRAEGEIHGTVVVLHGGYWKNRFGLDDDYGNAGTKSLAPFFLARGFSVVEVEYRRRDHEGGGWPGTNQDVLTAIQHLSRLSMEVETRMADSESDVDGKLAALKSLRPEKLILLGHSAGGCLALWAGHQLQKAGVKPLVVAAAPVADLVRAHELRVSDEGDAVERYMKQLPTGAGLTEYEKASPAALLPITFPLCVVYGDQDADVPPDLVRAYAEDAKRSAPELVLTVEIPGADHFQIVNAESEAWLMHIVPRIADAVRANFGDAAASALQ